MPDEVARGLPQFDAPAQRRVSWKMSFLGLEVSRYLIPTQAKSGLELGYPRLESAIRHLAAKEKGRHDAALELVEQIREAERSLPASLWAP